MKIALLGDIHGNDLALKAVLDAAQKECVDRLLVTGDLIGYYFSPLKVLNLLSEWKVDIVRGNHEEMLFRGRRDPEYLANVMRRYGSGIQIAIQQLNSEQLDSLCALPHPIKLEIDNNKIILCHGAPWNLDLYIYPQTEGKFLIKTFPKDSDLIVMGHTHYPMLKRVNDTLLVNPGSVGQPRDRKSGACWALFDTKTRLVEFRREHYDNSSLINECQLRHPELPYLSEVLQRS